MTWCQGHFLSHSDGLWCCLQLGWCDSPPQVFETSLRVNMNVYMEVIEQTVLLGLSPMSCLYQVHQVAVKELHIHL